MLLPGHVAADQCAAIMDEVLATPDDHWENIFQDQMPGPGVEFSAARQMLQLPQARSAAGTRYSTTMSIVEELHAKVVSLIPEAMRLNGAGVVRTTATTPQLLHRDVARDLVPQGAELWTVFLNLHLQARSLTEGGVLVPASDSGLPDPWVEVQGLAAVGDVLLFRSTLVHAGGHLSPDPATRGTLPRHVLFLAFGSHSGISTTLTISGQFHFFSHRPTPLRHPPPSFQFFIPLVFHS